MHLHITSRPGSAGHYKGCWAGPSGPPWRWETAAAKGHLPAGRSQRQTIVFRTPILLVAAVLVALGWVTILDPVLAAEGRIGLPGQTPSAILVAPGPGGVAISSDDPEALGRFTELFAALASVRSTAKEQTVVFYLKHAKATAVAEILEAVFNGGSLAEQPQQPFAPFFGGFGPSAMSTPTMSTPTIGPGGPFGGRMGFGSPFSRGRDTGAVQSGGAAGGAEGRTFAGRSSRQRTGPSGLSGAGVRITPDSRLNALIVQASPGDMDIIEELLKILDQQGTREVVAAEPRPRLIPLRHVPVQSVLGVLRQVYQDRLTNGGSSPSAGARGGPEQTPGMPGPGGPGSPGFSQPPGGPGAAPAQFFQQLAMAAGSAGRRGRAGAGAEELPKMALGADSRSNSLVVVAPDRLFEEVHDLVRQLDRPATEDAEAIQVLALRSGHSELVRRALPAFMGDRVRVGQATASADANGRRFLPGSTAATRRQRGGAGVAQPPGPQGPGTSSMGASATQPTEASPPGGSPVPGAGTSGGVGGQDGFGRRGLGAPLAPNAPSVPGGLAPGGGATGPPFGREELPAQPPGEPAFRGPLAPGPGEARPLPDFEPGSSQSPPGPLP